MDAPTPAMVAAAASWAAEFDSGRLSDDRQRACEDWCARDPRHRLVLERMLGINGDLGRLDQAGRTALRRTLGKRPHRGRGAIGAAIAGLALVITACLASQAFVLRAPFARHATTTEITHLTLPDGSRVDLDAGSRADFSESEALRRLTLYEGRAFMRVAPGAPFVVETRHAQATALGTAYVVRDEGASTLVTVVESKVRVCARGARQACEVLKAGERARVEGRKVTRLASVEPGSAVGWATGWIEVEDVSAAALLAELNRYRRDPIEFSAESLAGVRITGAYPIDDTDRAAESIARTAGLRVSRDLRGGLRISR